ncbi:putative WRKY transcription factor 71 [Cucumis melo var. makuwa]|uniref:Putative WRKY transcription factor 71 n=1 Tax=Cucumis melo var. makuwa TaxID=1194695 RepID=A0A5D3CN62_CUCMM|nr:putative WRKY transcription factor 71 [Cucumis melo var. makuwa]
MSDEMFKDLFYGGMDEYESIVRAFGITSDYSNNNNEISGTTAMNSSCSFSSSDAGGGEDDDSVKEKEKHISKDVVEDNGGENSKATGEVDHLEDGYRWRKYGQKAVKNSAYPRSYYRCTTQKCGVKKRVERSYEDPSIVITTYEGQHNHPIPATLRGNLSAASGTFPPSMLTPMPVVGGVGFLPAELLSNASSNNQAVGGGATVYSHNSFDYTYNGRQPEYGLLQDIFPAPSSFFNRQP